MLLAPPDQVDGEDAHIRSEIEQGGRYRDDPEEEYNEHEQSRSSLPERSHEIAGGGAVVNVNPGGSRTASEFDSGGHTPVTHQQYSSSLDSTPSSPDGAKANPAHALLATPANGNAISGSDLAPHLLSFPRIGSSPYLTEDEVPPGPRGWPVRIRVRLHQGLSRLSERTRSASDRMFHSLPEAAQTGLATCSRSVGRFMRGLWDFMNPPLWAMLAAIIVASVPSLQRLFFTEGTFINNSVTRAVSQSGGVAIPLILVVLGANLARNTIPNEDKHQITEEKEERNLIIAAIVSRMLLPIIIMGPLLAIAAKYIPVSILDDPIFVVVCFLLTGAPSALQLAQICQINGVYMGAMARLLFQSYVIWYVHRSQYRQIRTRFDRTGLTAFRILPSTLVLVMCALEVLEWAAE